MKDFTKNPLTFTSYGVIKWVCEPIHTHTNPWGRWKWHIYANTRLTAHFMCGLMSDLVICKFRKKYSHTWHWMSLLRPGVIKQHKPNPAHVQFWQGYCNVTCLARTVCMYWMKRYVYHSFSITAFNKWCIDNKSTQRAQTSSAKTAHYPHIARVPDQHEDPDHPKHLINCS